MQLISWGLMGGGSAVHNFAINIVAVALRICVRLAHCQPRKKRMTQPNCITEMTNAACRSTSAEKHSVTLDHEQCAQQGAHHHPARAKSASDRELVAE